MDRRTFLQVGACSLAVTVAGCTGNGADVSDVVVEPSEYEVSAEPSETITVELSNQSGDPTGVTITDPTGSVAYSGEVDGDGEVSHEAGRSGTFTVAVEARSRTAVRIVVEG